MGFALTVVFYLAAAVVGTIVFRAAPFGFVLKVLIADVAATVFLFIISLIMNNASVYDPYWSIAPIVILALGMYHFDAITTGNILLLLVVGYWGIRLTANWAYTFKGYAYQDWRYDMFKEKTGRLFPLVSLFGIMLFPTLVVFSCLLPVLLYLQDSKVRFLTVIGFLVCAGGATLQLVSDIQLQKFRRSSTDRSQIIRVGLWKHSRHPNYLGEILMWWGVCLIAVSALPFQLLLFAGAFINMLMFVFISIPMAENRLSSYKLNFEEYKNETRMLIPIRRFRNEDNQCEESSS